MSQVRVGGMEGKELHDSPSEILSVNSLGFIPSFGVSVFSFCEALS
jgi:hypothetical protein